ncbi:hypothetical protein F4810DRAFT_658583 [Camillea tinctor]|nr:hypothetical protein F4810DRAFT_658583 [Camillea tinctor]
MFAVFALILPTTRWPVYATSQLKYAALEHVHTILVINGISTFNTVIQALVQEVGVFILWLLHSSATFIRLDTR